MADEAPRNNDNRIQLYSSTEAIDEVVSKAKELLNQVGQYRDFLIQNKQAKAVELISAFYKNVAKEYKNLQHVKSSLSSDYSSLDQDSVGLSLFPCDFHG